MEKNQIRIQVEQEVKKWLQINKLRDREIRISSNAMEFIVEFINNIEEDPLRNWKEQGINFNHYQTQAISLIPNALNDVMRGRIIRTAKYLEIELTTWDIWSSLSQIIRNWCFIPRDI